MSTTNELVSQAAAALSLAGACFPDAGWAGGGRRRAAAGRLAGMSGRDPAAGRAATPARSMGGNTSTGDTPIRTIAIAAAAALSLLAARAAHAGEGNGEPFPYRAPGLAATAAPAFAADTGSAAYPDLAGRPVGVGTAGGPDVLPAAGSEGTVQTANSLPRGAADGMAAYAQAQSARPLAQQAKPPSGAAARTAQVWNSRPGG